jgi:hypothetical protein
MGGLNMRWQVISRLLWRLDNTRDDWAFGLET